MACFHYTGSDMSIKFMLVDVFDYSTCRKTDAAVFFVSASYLMCVRYFGTVVVIRPAAQKRDVYKSLVIVQILLNTQH